MYIHLLSRQSAVPGSVWFGCGGSAVGPLGGIHGVHSQDLVLQLSFPLLSTAVGLAPAPVHRARALWVTFCLFGTGPVLLLDSHLFQTVLCCGVGQAACALQKMGTFSGCCKTSYHKHTNPHPSYLVIFVAPMVTAESVRTFLRNV